MRIIIAGATGAVGQSLVPILIEAGHEVVAFTRHEAKSAVLRQQGAEAVIVDIYNRDAVFKAVSSAQPDMAIHQLTSLSERNFADNARIRIEGTRNFVDALTAASVNRIIAQSISWAYAPGNGLAKEEQQLDLDTPSPRKDTILAVHALETTVAEMTEYVILRYGLFYGKGTWYAQDGLMADQVRQGLMPATDGISSFIHIDDAAHAALLALEWPSGAVNIVDDEPAAGTIWLPYFASLLSAPAPSYKPGIPRGERGADNTKAKQYGWQPKYTSWREGFARTLK